MRYFASWSWGHWMVRAFGRFFSLKAPWNQPLFSERHRYGCGVFPLGFGWRIVIRSVRDDG